MTCPSCKGNTTLIWARFCPYCGSDLPTKPSEIKKCVAGGIRIARFRIPSDTLQPLDHKEALERAWDTTKTILAQRGGVVVRFKDGILYFYLPLERVRFDDAFRIVEIWHELQDALLNLGRELESSIDITMGLTLSALTLESYTKKKASRDFPEKEIRLLLEADEPGHLICSEKVRALIRKQISLEALGKNRWRYRGRRLSWREEIPFLGRQAELRRLWSWTERLQKEGEGTVALVSGPAGIGKTALLREHASRTRSQGVPTFRIACDEATPVTHRPFRNLLHLILGSGLLAQSTQTVLSKAALQDESAWQEITDDQIVSLVSNVLRALALHVPSLVAIEDLHHASPGARALWRRIHERLAKIPLLMLFSSRATEEGFGKSVALSSLPKDRAETFVQSAMRTEKTLSPRDRELILQCGGNPFFLTELARWLDEENPAFLPLEGVPKALIESALQSYPPHQQELLRQLSIFGRCVASTILADFRGQSSASLESLVGKVPILQLSPTSRTVEFVHDLYRKAAYEQLDELTKSAWHEAAGKALEKEDAYAEEIAHHYLRSRNDRAALRFCLRAADRLHHQSDSDTLESFLTKGETRARALKDIEALWAIEVHRFRKHCREMTLKTAEKQFQTLIKQRRWSQLRRRGERFALTWGTFLYERALYEKAWRAIQHHSLPPTHPDFVKLDLLRSRIGTIVGNRKQVTRTALKRIANRKLSLRDRASYWFLLGRTAYADRELRSAEDFYAKARSLSESADDHAGVRKAFRNLGNIYFARDDYKSARSYFVKGCDVALRTGSPDGLAECLLNLAHANEMLLNFSAAFRSYERALEEADLDLFSNLHNQVRLFSGDLYMELGDIQKAERLLLPADIYFMDYQDPYFTLKALRCEARLQLMKGTEVGIVISILDRALDLPSAYANQEQLVWLSKADCLLTAGREGEVRALLEDFQQEYRSTHQSQRVRLRWLRLYSRATNRSEQDVAKRLKQCLDEFETFPDRLERFSAILELLEYAPDPVHVREARKLYRQIAQAFPETYRPNFERRSYVQRFHEQFGTG